MVEVLAPVSLIRSMVVTSQPMTPPRMAFDAYICSHGMPEKLVWAAWFLVRRLPQCVVYTKEGKPMDGMTALCNRAGHSEEVMACWCMEEECQGFFRVLRRHAERLENIVDGYRASEEEWMPLHELMAAVKAFLDDIRVHRFGGSKCTRLLGFCCWHCRAPTNPGKVCAGCKEARYCSKDCQDWDWPIHAQRCKGREKSRSEG